MPAADVHTLVAANVTVWLACAVLLEFLRRTGRTYPGFGLWSAFAALGAVGWALGALRPAMPEGLSILASNGTLGAAIILLLAGGRRFLGRAMPWRIAGAAWLLHLLALAWFHWVHPSITARIVVVSALSLPVLGLFASDFFSADARRFGPPARLLAWSGSGLAATALVRATWTVLASQESPMEGLFDARIFQVFYFSAILVAVLLVSFGLVVITHRRLDQELVHARDQLQGSLDLITAKRAQIRVLEGLLPICASCKRIRREDGSWAVLEVFIRNHSEADFSHGICPECERRLYPEATSDDAP